MIQREGSGFDVSCDNCGNEEYFDAGNDWDYLIDLMRDNDWRSVKTQYGWEHYCSDCSEELYQRKKPSG